MKVTKTNFEGLIILEPKLFKDERGGFYETWRKEDYKSYGIKEDFVQDNISISQRNVLRGLHYQRDQGQLVGVSYGEIFDVVVDIRQDSPTYKKYFSIHLTGDKPQQIYMSPGFAHGFCVLSDIVVINYKCTQYYDPSSEGGVIWNDPNIGIAWPAIVPIISERDSQFKSLRENICRRN